jgi:broad specificity phosphatase PhoE
MASNPPSPPPAKFTYEALPNIFQQSDPNTDPSTFDNAAENFGLIPQPYPTDPEEAPPAEPLSDWQRFARYVTHLRATSAPETDYKVLYFGRHGEGHHNVAEAYYGTPAWDAHWSKLDGNGTVTWRDAHLTDLGESQARAAHAFLAAQFRPPRTMPAPDAYYVSPLWRCLQTADLSWRGLRLPAEKPYRPRVKELLREVLGEHTCDARSSRTAIHAGFPEYEIEEGFAEEDVLWRAEHRETWAEHDARTRELMDDVFGHEGGTFVSLTSHSGAIASHLRVLGHREFALPTGGMIPVVVRATRIG